MKTLLIAACLLCWTALAAAQAPEAFATKEPPSTTQPSVTSADDVMAKVYVRDRRREKLSQGYAGQRLYVFDNEKWHKHAELLVSVKGDPDGSKHFEVLSEEGWKAANKRVLRKMLESEAETSSPTFRPKTLLTPENYTFAMVRTELVEGRAAYVITVTPKRDDKYLFEGQIWVDAVDFAVVRCEGKPARNPSFWTRKIHFVHQYRKTSDFWFPHSTESITEARIFGTTNVVIHYFDYAPNTSPEPQRDSKATQNASLQKVNYVSKY